MNYASGLSEINSPYVVLPVYRGLTEVKDLFIIINAFSGFIAGGYARYCLSPKTKPAPPEDIDIFLREVDQYEPLVKALEERGAKIQIRTDNAVSLTPPEKWVACPKIQVINPTVMGGNVSIWDTIKGFDIALAQAAIVNEHSGIAYSEFETDEKGAFLKINRVQCPVGTALRLIKYSKKGYKAPITELIKLFEAWELLPVEKRDKLQGLINIPPEDRTEETKKTLRDLIYID